MSAKENSEKSRNGTAFEIRFSRETGLPKLTKKRKPIFINDKGKKQIVDADFLIEIGEKKVFLDLTTSFRSDRAKQKAYNGICCKLNCTTEVEFYIVIPDEHYKEVLQERRSPFSLHGLDGVIPYSEAVSMTRSET